MNYTCNMTRFRGFRGVLNLGQLLPSIAVLAFLTPAHAQWTQQGLKLVGTNTIGTPQQGRSVALSSDGNTALVGGPFDNNLGAVWVWTRSGGVWTQQAKLVGTGGSSSEQGWSVALSADGNTALVGGPQDDGNVGAAWAWTRSGNTWTQQGSKLVGAGAAGSAQQGASVALSADGNTALVGGPLDNGSAGAVWAWTRSSGVWTQNGSKLAGTGAAGSAQQGASVALSGDATTAFVGGPADNGTAGAVWVFIQSGGVWTQQGSKLVATNAVGQAKQGSSVALSNNGNTALVGGPADNSSSGAAWVWTRSGSAWTDQAKLIGRTSGEYPYTEGRSVSLSADGNTAFAGGASTTAYQQDGRGGTWVWSRSGSTWTPDGPDLIGTDGANAQQGYSVALSADGYAAIEGGPQGESFDGAAWVFTRPGAVSVTNNFMDFVGNNRSGALLYDPTLGQSYTALSNGDGTYQYVPNQFTPNFNILQTGDYNGDGKADLILYNSQTDLAYIGFGNGDGTFSFQSLFWSPGYDTVATGDINGDGKTDVALYNSTTGTLYTGIGNGDGTFSYLYHLVSQNFTFVRLADFTGDGKADLFLYDSNNGAAFLGVGDGTGNFIFNPLSISPGYAIADTGDLNGDGKADVILYNPANGDAATGVSNGTGGFNFTSLNFSLNFTSVRLADYTGDGMADVTVYDKTSGLAYFGTGTGTGNFTFQSLFWSPGYDSVIPEDVNGDGKTDVVLYDSATGTEYTGISNGDGTFMYTYQYWGIGKVLAR
jgi:hypothetical protein